MKKFLVLGLLVAGIAMAQGNVAEIRAGVNLAHSAKNTKGELEIKKEVLRPGFEIAGEYRKQITDAFDLGAGIAYNYNKLSSKKLGDGYTTKGLHSVPIFGTARYNFRNSSDITPYVKANLGFAFNSGSVKYEDIFEKGESKFKSGMYYGLGAGLTYNNFVADLSYNINALRFKYNTEKIIGTTAYYASGKETFNHGMLTLSVGYTFGF